MMRRYRVIFEHDAMQHVERWKGMIPVYRRAFIDVAAHDVEDAKAIATTRATLHAIGYNYTYRPGRVIDIKPFVDRCR